MNINSEFVKELENFVITSFEEAKKIEKNIRQKELNDIVTDIDIYMENKIIDKIKEYFPDHAIYSEEKNEIIGESEYIWFIDPIDGTINFSTDIPLFSTSIALKKNDETIFGFIYDYSNHTVYHAIKGKGAYCNDKRIYVSDKTELSESIISFCLTSHYNVEKINDVLEVERCLAPKVRGLRLIVSAAIELAWLAEGKIDGCLNVKASAGISSAAGKLLVVEAGGKVTNIQGNERKKIDTMLVSNGKIHSKLVKAMKYALFIGNTTEVIEINNNFFSNSNIYLAGKAYSQAISGAKKGLNCKLMTVVSGLKKNELDGLILEAKKYNIDTSYIFVSNNIANDIKIVFKNEAGEKIHEEDILNGVANAITEEMIFQNEDVIKNSSYVICQTKIDIKTLKRVVDICNLNSVPIIITPSRPKEISISRNPDNKILIDKFNMMICDENEFYEIFGDKNKKEDVLKTYSNRLILITDTEGICYFDGMKMIKIYEDNYEKIKKVGMKDFFIGNFIRILVEKEDLRVSIEGALRLLLEES